MQRLPGPITIVSPGSTEEALIIEDSLGNSYPVRGPDVQPGYAVADYLFIEPVALAIVTANSDDDYIEVEGDHFNTQEFRANDAIIIDGSTGNDGAHTIVSLIFDGTLTRLYLDEGTVVDDTTDGTVVRSAFAVRQTLPARTTLLNIELFPQVAPWNDSTAVLNAVDDDGAGDTLLANIDLSGDLTDNYDPTDVTTNINYVSLGSAPADFDANVTPFGTKDAHGGGIYYQNGTILSIVVAGIVTGAAPLSLAPARLRVRVTTATAPPTVIAR